MAKGEASRSKHLGSGPSGVKKNGVIKGDPMKSQGLGDVKLGLSHPGGSGAGVRGKGQELGSVGSVGKIGIRMPEAGKAAPKGSAPHGLRSDSQVHNEAGAGGKNCELRPGSKE